MFNITVKVANRAGVIASEHGEVREDWKRAAFCDAIRVGAPTWAVKDEAGDPASAGSLEITLPGNFSGRVARDVLGALTSADLEFKTRKGLGALIGRLVDLHPSTF